MRRYLAATFASAAILAGFGVAAASEDLPPYAHTLYAIVKQVKPTQLIVQKRDGRMLTVDITAARRAGRTGVLYANRAVALHGDYDALKVFHTVSIGGAAGIKFTPAAWPNDE